MSTLTWKRGAAILRLQPGQRRQPGNPVAISRLMIHRCKINLSLTSAASCRHPAAAPFLRTSSPTAAASAAAPASLPGAKRRYVHQLLGPLRNPNVELRRRVWIWSASSAQYTGWIPSFRPGCGWSIPSESGRCAGSEVPAGRNLPASAWACRRRARWPGADRRAMRLAKRRISASKGDRGSCPAAGCAARTNNSDGVTLSSAALHIARSEQLRQSSRRARARPGSSASSTCCADARDQAPLRPAVTRRNACAAPTQCNCAGVTFHQRGITAVSIICGTRSPQISACV